TDPDVQAAVVTGREDEAGEDHLVAYLVPKDRQRPPAPDRLRELVAARLPAYMIPAAWVVIDALPVTPNGKVNIDDLPAPVFDRSAVSEELIAPRTETERRVAQVWSVVIMVDNIVCFGIF